MSEQRTALVTGAAGGIGEAVAARLAEDGFRVLMTDLDEARLKVSADRIGADWMVCDLGDADAREKLIEKAGDLFALVNNAGIFSTADASDLGADDFRRMYEINTIAGFELSKLAALRMRKVGAGRIVNIASRSYLGAVKIAHYAASKGAVVTLTKCLALEWAADGILVNAIAPGVIDTPILEGWDAEERAKLASYQPVGTIGKPEDIANVAAMLASPRTQYLTGQCLVVDGGRSIGGGNV